jgi:hypothetical protein
MLSSAAFTLRSCRYGGMSLNNNRAKKTTIREIMNMPHIVTPLWRDLRFINISS